jgi:hypothetical protein
MKLKDWKKRVKDIRENNKRTRIYTREIRRFNLPTQALQEGEIYIRHKLERDNYNFYGEKLNE